MLSSFANRLSKPSRADYSLYCLVIYRNEDNSSKPAPIATDPDV